MRLDKFVSSTLSLSRTDAKKLIFQGKITVDGIVQKKVDYTINEHSNIVKYNDQVLLYEQFTYIMLNKPLGYVSAAEDKNDPTIIDLLCNDLQKKNLFPCGRLDKYTSGLMILTNDGDFCHKVISPNSHIEKEYYFECESKLNQEDIHQIENGICDNGIQYRPAKLKMNDDYLSGTITLTEGKYHEIRIMFFHLHNKILVLKRIRQGNLKIDENLPLGSYRKITENEKNSIIERV